MESADHYYCDEGTDEDPTPVHRCNQNAPYLPNYVFHDGVDPVAYHLLSKEPSEVIHEACAKTPNDREFPLYPEDIEAMRNLEPIVCDVCEAQIAPATDRPTVSAQLTDQPCSRCDGTGEVEGYGGNYIYCGLCAGTGKTPEFKF